MTAPNGTRRHSRRMQVLLFLAVTAGIVGLPFMQSGQDVTATGRFFVQFATFVAIYAIVTLGLNVHVGNARILNFGVAGFFMVGAYAASLVVLPPSSSATVQYIGGSSEALEVLGGTQWVPFLVAIVVAAAASAVLALVLSILMLRLGAVFLAIATIGMAELLRAVVTIERGLVNGASGLVGIPRPLASYFTRSAYPSIFLVLALVTLVITVIALQRSITTPYGRSLRAVREDEVAAAAAGKNVQGLKLQAFVLGAAVMGVAGALFAWFLGGLTPTVFNPVSATFLFWIMLTLGGIGSNFGAIGGAYVVWGIWSITSLLTSYGLPDAVESSTPHIRIVVLGILFIVTLLYLPDGIVPERRQVSRWVKSGAREQ